MPPGTIFHTATMESRNKWIIMLKKQSETHQPLWLPREKPEKANVQGITPSQAGADRSGMILHTKQWREMTCMVMLLRKNI